MANTAIGESDHTKDPLHSTSSFKSSESTPPGAHPDEVAFANSDIIENSSSKAKRLPTVGTKGVKSIFSEAEFLEDKAKLKKIRDANPKGGKEWRDAFLSEVYPDTLEEVFLLSKHGTLETTRVKMLERLLDEKTGRPAAQAPKDDDEGRVPSSIMIPDLSKTKP